MTTYKKKVSLIGPVGVGKTSIFSVFTRGIFPESYKSTFGRNISEKDVSVMVDGTPYTVKFVIVDVMGDNSYESLINPAIKNSEAYIFVCDLTDPLSLDSLSRYWVHKAVDMNHEAVRIFVGNKLDLEDQLKFGEDELAKIAGGSSYILTSAKENKNINELFSTLAFDLLGSTKEVVVERSLKSVMDSIFREFGKYFGRDETWMDIIRTQAEVVEFDHQHPDPDSAEDLVNILSDILLHRFPPHDRKWDELITLKNKWLRSVRKFKDDYNSL